MAENLTSFVNWYENRDSLWSQDLPLSEYMCLCMEDVDWRCMCVSVRSHTLLGNMFISFSIFHKDCQRFAQYEREYEGKKSELLEAVRHPGKRNLHFTWTLTVGHWQREGTGLVKSNEIFMYFMR